MDTFTGLISRWMRFWQTRRLYASPDLSFMVISFPRIPYKRNQLYVNNVPGVFTQFNTPLYPIESLELISGPNVGIYGTGVQYETTNPGGIVSVKSKVAPDKGVFDYTQTISGRGLW